MRTSVTLKAGSRRLCRLSLERTPRLLRFVRAADGTWDALDQLDHDPQEGEHVVAARLVDTSSLYLDDGYRNGRRFGETRLYATYEPVPDQPGQAVLTDRAAWRAWATEQAAKPYPVAPDDDGEG